MREQLSPWEKIMRAYRRGTGLRLTKDEIDLLGSDSAIEQSAENCRSERAEYDLQVGGEA
jgi:hypothetical protein